MKRLSVWVTVLAIVLALLPLASLWAADGGTWTGTGWITDDSCGAKGAKAEHAACAKKCLEKGGKLVFYNNADKKIYKLDKQDVAKEHIGHEVTVKGAVEGDSITVATIEASAKPAP